MSWFYCIKEGFDGILRAKMATLIAIITMAGALTLMGIFALASMNLMALIETLRSRIALEVFIDNGRDEESVVELQKLLQSAPGVASVEYISRQEAAEVFRKEFGDEFLKLLESNPLPRSFRITLAKSHQHSDQAERVAQRLQGVAGVDEVVYRAAFFKQLDRYLGLAAALALFVGLLVCLGSIFVVINQVRLVAYAKRRIIETMQLVGADRFFIHGPFLIQGLIQGICGGALSTLLIQFASRFLFTDFGEIFSLPEGFFTALILSGIVLGLLAAHWGVRRFVS